ncbi:hypothetical protein BBJ28_00022984 [Nothophytophthora sp. Chile5]|nr:hypothetical protein BBJ28_00022984 [Nothophytophthora sp. Chile5]
MATRRRPRSWRSLVEALRDPQRSDFAFVPHQYMQAPSEASLSPSESTPINGRPEYAHRRRRLAHQRNGFFLLHVAAMGLAGVACAWLALFPISPTRLYNMQVDVFRADHAHAEFFFRTCLYLGNVLGAALAGYLGDRLGRAGTLELAAIPFVVGWVLVGVAYGELTVLAGRYLLGAAAGMVSVVAPVYLAEVSAAQTRGRVLCTQALLAALGSLCYLALGGLFVLLSRQYFGFNLSEWKVLALSGVVPGMALLLCAQKLPDSPTWLIGRHDDHSAAFDVLLRLFDHDDRIAEDEANAIIHAKVLAASDRRHHGAFFRPVLLCAALFTLRAVSAFLLEPAISSTVAAASSRGIGGSHSNASFVLTEFGVAAQGAEDALVAVRSAIAVAATTGIAACFFLVDTRGRLAALRGGCYVVAGGCVFLLVAVYRSTQGAAGSGVALSDSGWAAMLLVVAGHQLGLGVVPVILASELFAVKQRMGAVSLVIIWEALVKLVLAHALPMLREVMPSSADVFGICAGVVLVCNLAGVAMSWFYVPETSRHSLQEIEAILSGWQPATPRREGSSRIRLDYGSSD